MFGLTLASRAHINLDFRFNSQPLVVAFTDRESIGGRAWPNVKFDNPQFDHIFTVWCNSTLGLLCFWWHSNRQVAGRGTTTKTTARTLPVLDFRALTNKQIRTAEDVFDEFRDRELMPAYLADADSNRALLDRRVICDPPQLRRKHLPSRPPPVRQVVRRAVGARGEGEAGRHPGHVSLRVALRVR